MALPVNLGHPNYTLRLSINRDFRMNDRSSLTTFITAKQASLKLTTTNSKNSIKMYLRNKFG